MSNFLLISNFGTRILRWIFFALDTAIYALAKVVYMIFANIASVRLVDSDMAKLITQRVYAILGVAMIFVIAFNLLNYIIDPDKINDKKVGASTFIKDILICLVVTSVMPVIFDKLYGLQNQVLTSNVISNLIFGVEGNGDIYEDYNDNKEGSETMAAYQLRVGANTMVANIFSAFFRPNSDSFSYMDCVSDFSVSNDATNNEILNSDRERPYCEAYLSVKQTGDIQKYKEIYTSENYKYDVLISTAAGVVLVFFMFSFCLDLAKRVGKMAILQLLAPVPLAMEILPNKKGTRSQWVNTLLTVYLEVFIFQTVVYLVIFLITLLPGALSVLFKNGFAAGNGFVKAITFVVLCFGLFNFGKEAPKMVMDLLGIKSSGTISAAFKRAGTMAGVATNTVGSTIGNAFRGYNENKGKGKGRQVLGALGGGSSAFARNLWAGRNAHSWKDAKANRLAINQDISDRRIQQHADEALYGGWSGALKHRIRDRYYGATSKLSAATGHDFTPNQYLTKQKSLDAYNEYKALHKGITDIWEGDSEYQMYNNEYKKALSSGDNALAAKFKASMDSRKTSLIKKNSDRIADATRKINNFAATHQNIEGFQDIHFSEEAVIRDAKSGVINSDISNLHHTIFGGDVTHIETVRDKNGNPVKETIFEEREVPMVQLIVDGVPQKRDVYETRSVKVGEEPVMVQAVDKVTGKPQTREIYETQRVKVGEKEVEDYARYPDGKIITKRVKEGKKWVEVGTKVKRKVDVYENQQVKVGEEPVMIEVIDETTGKPKMRDVYEEQQVVVGQEDVYVTLDEARSKYGYAPTKEDDIIRQKQKVAVGEREVTEAKTVHESGNFDRINTDTTFRAQRNEAKNSQEKAQAVRKAQAEKKEGK